MDIKEQAIDSMHWQEYIIIDKNNVQHTGSLTQKSEERLADQIIPLVRADTLKAVENTFVTGVIQGELYKDREPVFCIDKGTWEELK